MSEGLLIVAAALQAFAVAYALFLFGRRRAAAAAWLWLLGGMLSMLTWRVVVVFDAQPPAYFNPLIAIWGSTCMVAAMFFFGREVARREKAEADRDALLESERAARGEAERVSRLKDDFVATLSHELRSPLAAILGWCHVLRAPEARARLSGADLERALVSIARSAEAQARLVDDLLDATRMQAGMLRLELAPVALDGIVQSAVEALRPVAEKKGLRLRVTAPAEPVRVPGDAGRLHQVVSNLVGNAIKFTPTGGTVEVEVRADRDLARLEVRDDGDGIHADFLPHVFQRFRQADGTLARRHGGLGLGLSIVDSLVRLHGGSVHAASAGPGRGATFTVTLPRTAEAVPAPEAAEVDPPGGHPEEVRVLLVDDDADIRLVVSRILEDAGMKVLALESAADVTSAVESFSPSVLVTDIGMPGEDGYTLMRRLARSPGWRERGIGAIAFTAHARDEDRGRALASGFAFHLPKPVDAAQLLRAVRHVARGAVRTPDDASPA